MLKRILSATVLLPLTLFLVQQGGLLFHVMVLSAIVLMLVEFSQFSNSIDTVNNRFFTVIAGLILVIPAMTSKLELEHSLLIILFFAFATELLFDRASNSFSSIANLLTGTIYIGLVFGYHGIKLRQIDGSPNFIFCLFTTVWIGDASAYFFGKRFGKHPLRQNISPNKTIEGMLAGLFFGSIGGILIWAFLLKNILPFSSAIGMVLLIGVTAQIGDLSESLIKRSAGVKDSGTLIPGHGGLLDRVDSLIFSTPTLFYYMHFVVGDL